MALDFALCTDVGHVRPTNQDRMYADVKTLSDVTCGIFCVADGMGGLADGHVAADFTVESIRQWWQEVFQPGIEINPSLVALFSTINESIRDWGRQQGKRYGTTCSVLLICEHNYFIVHTGDSRIYLMQKPTLGRKKIVQLTEDHNWLADQQRLGFLPKDEMQINPNKNKLTGGLGDFEYPRVFTYTNKLKKSDTFILCSDGLYRLINDRELTRAAARFPDCEALATGLMQSALAGKADDNVSVMVVRFGGVHITKTPGHIKNDERKDTLCNNPTSPT